MKSKEEVEKERDLRFLEKFMKMYEQLTPWEQFLMRFHAYRLLLRRFVKGLPARWVEFQLDLERDIARFGMPFQIWRKLVKWFNISPWPEVTTYFLWKGRKVWYSSFLEDDNYEIILHYKNRMPGALWFHPEKDGTASIIGIDIREEFRNAGLGTAMFHEAIRQLKGRVTCIKGTLESEYYPKPEDSLRWLRRQGFEISQNQNGDYHIEFKIK